MIKTGVTDAEILETWSAWERPETIKQFLLDWIAMTYEEKLAFFCGMVLPQRCGRRAYDVPLRRIHELSPVSRYPSKIAA